MSFISHANEVTEKVEQAMRKAATMVGGTVEGHAKEMCPVKTGLLRNSITYALGGQSTNISSYTSDDGSQSGSYNGTAPADDKGQVTVYIGTNVKYGPYRELGTVKMSAKPFLRPGFENSQSEIQQILQQVFSELG